MRRWLQAATVVWLACCGSAGALHAEEEQQAAAIKVVNAPNDQAISARLKAITSAIAGMESVETTVNSGVLTLQGQIANAQLKSEIGDIARRLEGVVHVQNQLQEEVAVRSRLQPAAHKFRDMLRTTVQMLPLLLVAAFAAVAFWLLGSWLSGRKGLLRRLGMTELATNLSLRFVRFFVTGIGVLIALELLDATAMVSAVLGVAGVIGIAVGFAFRNIVENYLAGVLLSTRNPFKIGDFVQVDDMSGNVVRLTSRDTVLMTLDGNHLRIPNSQLITSPMTNFSRNPLRRFEFDVGVSVDLDLIAVRQLAVATLEGMPGILAEPRPRVLIQALGDSTVSVRISAWIDQRDTDVLKARSEAIRLVKAAFDHAGIEMPEPIYRVHLSKKPSGTAPGSAAAATVPRSPESSEESLAAVDVSTDGSIEQQLSDDLKYSDEENLLPGGPAAANAPKKAS